jgi:hypothetical protein
MGREENEELPSCDAGTTCYFWFTVSLYYLFDINNLSRISPSPAAMIFASPPAVSRLIVGDEMEARTEWPLDQKEGER